MNPINVLSQLNGISAKLTLGDAMDRTTIVPASLPEQPKQVFQFLFDEQAGMPVAFVNVTWKYEKKNLEGTLGFYKVDSSLVATIDSPHFEGGVVIREASPGSK
jgi:hypothetical protein